MFPSYHLSNWHVMSTSTTTSLDLLPPTGPFAWFYPNVSYRLDITFIIHHSIFNNFHQGSSVYGYKFNSPYKLMSTIYIPISSTLSYASQAILLNDLEQILCILTLLSLLIWLSSKIYQFVYYLNILDTQCHISFKCTTVEFNKFIPYLRSPQCSYHLFPYIAVIISLTLLFMLGLLFPWLIHSITGRLYLPLLIIHFAQSPTPLPSGNHRFVLCIFRSDSAFGFFIHLWVFFFVCLFLIFVLSSTDEWNHTASVKTNTIWFHW